jgi:hypothetical protein
VCENELLTLLQYENFDLIKLLCINRKPIVYCTRLLRAAGDASARAAIEDEMRNDVELERVLERLQHKRKAGERTTGGAAGAAAAASSSAAAAASSSSSAASKDGGATAKAIPKSGVVDNDDENAVPQLNDLMGASVSDAPLKLLDIDSMAFLAGGHLMSNKQCIMPANAVSVPGKGYTQVHIPARVAVVAPSEKLVPTDALPEWARPAFTGMQSFNRVQSRVYEAVFKSADNVLMCAPTGAGKTNVAMLAMMHQLALHRNPETGDIALDQFKIVYVAPMKALVQEVVQNFSNRLEKFGIVVREVRERARARAVSFCRFTTSACVCVCVCVCVLFLRFSAFWRSVADEAADRRDAGHRHDAREVGYHYAQVGRAHVHAACAPADHRRGASAARRSRSRARIDRRPHHSSSTHTHAHTSVVCSLFETFFRCLDRSDSRDGSHRRSECDAAKLRRRRNILACQGTITRFFLFFILSLNTFLPYGVA